MASRLIIVSTYDGEFDFILRMFNVTGQLKKLLQI